MRRVLLFVLIVAALLALVAASATASRWLYGYAIEPSVAGGGGNCTLPFELPCTL